MTLALVLAALAAAVAPAPPDTAACPGGRTLTRADLVGTVYLDDVLARLGVARTSVDGRAWRAHVGGAVPFAEPAWDVYVDGVWVAPSMLTGEDGLQVVPVVLEEVEAVTHCPGAAFSGGRFAAGGRLLVRTSRGRAARGVAQLGNETGDPGPLRYVDPSVPNVDKLGPDWEAAVALGPRADAAGRRGRASASARFLRFYPSDPAVAARNQEVSGRFPAVRVGTAALRAGGPGVEAQVVGGYDADLLFFDATGRELPVRRLSGQGTVQAAHALGALAVRGETGLAFASFDRRPELPATASPGFAPRWRESRSWMSVEAEAGPWSFGGRAEGTAADGPGLAGSGGFLLGRAWARLGAASADGRLRSTTALALVTAGGRATGEALQALARDVGPGGQLALTLAFDGHLPDEDARAGYWRARGYTGLDRAATPYDASGGPRAGWRARARLDGHAPLALGVRAAAHVEGRALRELYVERGVFELDSSAVAVSGPVQAVPDARGGVLGVGADVEATRGAWRLGVAYRFEAPVGGDEAFAYAWAVVPRHVGIAAASFRPDAGFALRLALDVQSPTRWPAYAALGGVPRPVLPGIAPAGAFAARTPGLALLEAAVEKGLAGGRLRLMAAVRNGLDVEERYHPLGADLALRLYARVALRL